ncbi:MAG: ABC transporter permease [Clostridia bacterium]
MENLDTVSPYRQAYLVSIRRRERFIRNMRYLILFTFLTLWELSTRLGWIDPFITSSPCRVMATILRLLRAHELFTHIGVTLFETIAGFLLGTLLGTMVAALLWWSDTACRVLDPYLVVLNALPKIALGPILIVWIGAGIGSIIVMAVLISLVVTIVTVLTGFRDTTDEKQLLMKTLGATKLQIFGLVVLPASVPTIVAALKISVSMSWVGVIVGEYLVSKAGLGFLIVYGGQVFKLDLVMASIVVLCTLAALMYYGVAYIERKLVK